MRFGAQTTAQRSGLPSAFTLVELLLVCAIIGILASLFLPTLGRAKLKAQRVSCINNLRQIGTSFIIFAHDIEHRGQFPVRVSTNAGGALEFVPPDVAIAEVFQAFASVSNELSTPKILRCPTDPRPAANNFSALRPDNVSYFAGVQANPNQPQTVAAGDRNVIFRSGEYAWNQELHRSKGNLLFSDTHVEERNSWPVLLAISSPAPPLAPSEAPNPTPDPPTQPDPSSGGANGPGSGTGAANSPSPQKPSSNSPPPVALSGSMVKTTRMNKSAITENPTATSPFHDSSTQKVDHNSTLPTETADDNTPDPPPIKFAQHLIHVGFSISLLWALIVLLLFMWKKIRERRAEDEDATRYFETIRDEQDNSIL